MTFDQFVETVRHLRRDRSGGRPKPYKPLMLASVVILIHKGEIRTREVFLDGGLESVFFQLLRKLYPGEFETARPIYPFLHLETDRVWKLVPRDGASESLRAAKANRASEWRVLKSVRCAELDHEVFEALASSFQNRFRVLQALVQTYDFPRDRTGHLWELLSTEEEVVPVPVAREPSVVSERAVEQHLHDQWDGTEFARLGIELSSEEKHGLPCRQVLTPRTRSTCSATVRPRGSGGSSSSRRAARATPSSARCSATWGGSRAKRDRGSRSAARSSSGGRTRTSGRRSLPTRSCRCGGTTGTCG
jgi:hypothetical protein